MNPPPKKGQRRRANSDGGPTEGSSTFGMKKVVFDEIMIKEYPIILGDHPAVSSGAPITIGWKPINESVIDLDFYEYCRIPERKSRKKMILSVRRRANVLLSAGYSLEEIGNATLDVEKTKKMRADSLRASGWNNPWELLSGAVETTGTALKRADVLGVGAAAGAVVGAGASFGAAVGGAANNAVRNTARASLAGVNTVADVTVQTGKFLASGVNQSSRAVMGVTMGVAGGVVEGGRIVTKPVVGAGKAVVKPVQKVMTGVVTGTSRALATVVSPLTGGMNATKDGGASNVPPPALKRRTSVPMQKTQ